MSEHDVPSVLNAVREVIGEQSIRLHREITAQEQQVVEAQRRIAELKREQEDWRGVAGALEVVDPFPPIVFREEPVQFDVDAARREIDEQFGRNAWPLEHAAMQGRLRQRRDGERPLYERLADD